MKAQVLYDLRDTLEFCSGNDLHEFFAKVTGDPSPSGKAEIPFEQAAEFVGGCILSITVNSGAEIWRE